MVPGIGPTVVMTGIVAVQRESTSEENTDCFARKQSKRVPYQVGRRETCAETPRKKLRRKDDEE